jgi:calcineurin-like phosphoesterase family protein
MNWLTADNHFGHSKIIEYCNRPFTNVDEMDDIMIENWNSVVDDLDTVYHLGDIVFGDRKNFDKYIRRLKGNIKIIPGNHDWRWLAKWDRYNDYMQPKSLSGIGIDVLDAIHVLKDMPNKGNYIVLCHYPIAMWDRSHYNSYHLHGHSHGEFHYQGKIYDVGVDGNNYYPIPIDKIVDIMETKSNNVNYLGDRNNAV